MEANWISAVPDATAEEKRQTDLLEVNRKLFDNIIYATELCMRRTRNSEKLLNKLDSLSMDREIKSLARDFSKVNIISREFIYVVQKFNMSDLSRRYFATCFTIDSDNNDSENKKVYADCFTSYFATVLLYIHSTFTKACHKMTFQKGIHCPCEWCLAKRSSDLEWTAAKAWGHIDATEIHNVWKTEAKEIKKRTCRSHTVLEVSRKSPESTDELTPSCSTSPRKNSFCVKNYPVNPPGKKTKVPNGIVFREICMLSLAEGHTTPTLHGFFLSSDQLSLISPMYTSNLWSYWDEKRKAQEHVGTENEKMQFLETKAKKLMHAMAQAVYHLHSKLFVAHTDINLTSFFVKEKTNTVVSAESEPFDLETIVLGNLASAVIVRPLPTESKEDAELFQIALKQYERNALLEYHCILAEKEPWIQDAMKKMEHIDSTIAFLREEEKTERGKCRLDLSLDTYAWREKIMRPSGSRGFQAPEVPCLNRDKTNVCLRCSAQAEGDCRVKVAEYDALQADVFSLGVSFFLILAEVRYADKIARLHHRDEQRQKYFDKFRDFICEHGFKKLIEEHRKVHGCKIVSDGALDFLDNMLKWNPADRPTISKVLKDEFFRGVSS